MIQTIIISERYYKKHKEIEKYCLLKHKIIFKIFEFLLRIKESIFYPQEGATKAEHIWGTIDFSNILGAV